MHTTIIAEAGVNHNGSMTLAKQMVEKAKQAGADYVKFQTFVPEKLVSRFAQKAESKEPPVYLVFFKGRDQDALNAAFREFSQKQIQKANKPSIHKRLATYRAMMPKKSKDKVKNRHQEQSR